MTARFKHISGSNLVFLPSSDGTYAFTYDYALISFKPISLNYICFFKLIGLNLNFILNLCQS